ncbi:MAG: polysaccharide deacetylase family protein [Propionibacteriaceae bacterium]
MTDLSRRVLLITAAGGLAAAAGCGPGARPVPTSTGQPAVSPGSEPRTPTPSATAASPRPSVTPRPRPRSSPASDVQIAARATVPVLCWHQLRNWTSSDDSYARTLLICPPATFRAQLDALAEGGWTTIGPDQYLAHLTAGATLPAKPVLLSFDDSQGSQITEGLPQLQARKMTATFFAMTVVLDKPGWFSRRDLRRLDDAGMTVAAHTWDHHRVDQYTGRDWSLQLKKPRELLEKILGKPVDHFAYPYGAWNAAALPHVEAAGYRSAYQLADKTPSTSAPRYTLRRELVASTWSGRQLVRQLQSP